MSTPNLAAVVRFSEMSEMAADLFPSTDHDLLIKISVQLERLMGDVKEVSETVSQNQESRLRALENFRWWILGACSALSFLGGAVAHFVFAK